VSKHAKEWDWGVDVEVRVLVEFIAVVVPELPSAVSGSCAAMRNPQGCIRLNNEQFVCEIISCVGWVGKCLLAMRRKSMSDK
jgi:hypothetical protein